MGVYRLGRESELLYQLRVGNDHLVTYKKYIFSQRRDVNESKELAAIERRGVCAIADKTRKQQVYIAIVVKQLSKSYN